MRENKQTEAGIRNPYQGYSSVYDLEYHLVWATESCNVVFNEPERKYLRHLLLQIAQANESKVETITITPNQVHLLLLMTPKISLSVMMMKLKGTAARKLLMQFPELKDSLASKHLWSHSYYASTIGVVNENIVKNYLETEGEHSIK